MADVAICTVKDMVGKQAQLSHGAAALSLQSGFGKASYMAPTLALFWPAMSKTVPCAGVATGMGRPPATVTPRSKPNSLIAICP
jgi:hypothetical protein